MSTFTHDTITNHNHHGFLATVGETIHIWRQRQLDRRTLAQLSERDLHDVGLSWSDVVYEAEKPFWRA